MPRRREFAELAYSVGRGTAIAFIVLLIIAAVLLALGREQQANRLAEYAYYSLVVSVFSLILSTVLEPEDSRGETSTSRAAQPSTGQSPRLGERLTVKKLSSLKRWAVYLPAMVSALAASIGLSLGYIYGVAVIPGRPSIPVTHSMLPYWLPYIVAPLLSFSGILAIVFDRKVAGGVAVSLLGSLTPFIPALGVIGALVLLYVARTELITVLTILVTGFLMLWGEIVYGIRSIHVAYAWSVYSTLAVAGYVLAFAYAVLILLAALLKPAKSIAGGRGASSGAREYRALAYTVSIVFAVVAVAAAHIIHHGALSTDTFFNVKMCQLLARGGYKSVLLGWYRPLYALLITLPASLAGCPASFFDVVLPGIGLAALTYTSLRLLEEIGVTGAWLLAGGVLAASYWAPFFLYAGLQTNLLALPPALLLAYLYEARRLRGVAVLATILALWHPWTLAYFTVALIVYEYLYRREGGARRLLYALGPSWAIYSLLAVATHLAGFPGGVEAVAISSTRLHNHLWSIKLYFWGTMMRPEIALLSLLLIKYILAGENWVLEMPGFLVAASIPAMLGLVIPQGKLLVRLWVDSPIPLLTAWLLYRINGVREAAKGYLAYMLIVSTAIIIIHYIYALNPLSIQGIKLP